MNMENTHYLPGSLVKARGRAWVVQNGSADDWLKLRPLAGAEDEEAELSPLLEAVGPADFPMPDPERNGAFSCAKLLYDALRFELRSGAGPFRSFGSIAVEPRSYQLVPLMMALRQETVRLLIADDVGIGKTIEAGLILRELIDRGAVSSAAVLCPPHLVDQWTEELQNKFNIHAEALTASSAASLEKRVPHGRRLVDEFPYLVVSLDYIKSERHRDHFRTIAPACIIVDEAHACTRSGDARQLRFDLLKKLADDKTRHMLFLTATPHSGNEEAFYNLLSLLDPEFEKLKDAVVRADDPLRQKLARHFVQRRRIDIDEWQKKAAEEGKGFPTRETTEITYKLSNERQNFFFDVQDYCDRLVKSADGKNALIWYAVLALLRCVSSSPRAAVKALENRLAADADLEREVLSDFADGGEEMDETSDIEPAARTEESEALMKLLADARRLETSGNDHKLSLLEKHVESLLQSGYQPVVFCRYIATAEYVAEALKDKFPGAAVECVTGALVPEERRERVEALGSAEKRILVATDCLSEGINLQEHFTAVVHYDLAWNPTRHEQREGRVDRFGQRAKTVRCSMIYGQNNPVDGFVLNVILKKSQAIQKSLGVIVPVPEDQTRINEALVRAALFKKPAGEAAQMDLLADDDGVAELNEKWTDAIERVSRVRTVFAQRALHPEDVYPLWTAQQKVLGSHEDLAFFCREASALMGCRLEETGTPEVFRVPVHAFRDESLRVRFADEGIEENAKLDFDALHRSSPFVRLLSEAFVAQATKEGTEGAADEARAIARSAVTESAAVARKTAVFLLRIRYQMMLRYRNQLRRCLLAEEVLPVAAEGFRNTKWGEGEAALALLSEASRANLSREAAARNVRGAIEFYESQGASVRAIAEGRAKQLLSDHQRLREYSTGGAVTEVKVCSPIDLMGVFVLLPADDEE